MAYENHTIQRAWHDVLVYDEGDGRRMELSCPSLEEPPNVTLPARELWLDKTPPWAHERRAIILDRLRSANCVVHERGNELTTILSPDRTFLIESRQEYDERSGPWESVCIVGVPGNAVVVSLPGYQLGGTVRFPAAGSVVLRLGRNGQWQQILINVAAGAFSFHPSERNEPLSELYNWLNAMMRSAPTGPIPQPGLRQALGNAGLFFTGLLFVAAGTWMSIAGKTAKDRWIGVICVLFFGLCAAVGFRDMLPRRRK